MKSVTRALRTIVDRPNHATFLNHETDLTYEWTFTVTLIVLAKVKENSNSKIVGILVRPPG